VGITLREVCEEQAAKGGRDAFSIRSKTNILINDVMTSGGASLAARKIPRSGESKVWAKSAQDSGQASLTQPFFAEDTRP
jgi:orotate phosphoribosyltransferase